MKKKLKQNTILAVVSIFFTSCSKCVDCASCPEGVTLDQSEICQNDFDSKEDYDLAVELIEALGCECK